jgi:serine/threonine-protein kinase
VYSLAAMTYEMLTGEPPHTGTSAQAIIAKLMTEDVRPLTVLRRTVPAHVDTAVRHGLEKLAADRFATAGDFALALTGARALVPLVPLVPVVPTGTAAATSPRTRMLVPSLAVIAVAAAAAVWFATHPAPPPPPPARFSLELPDSVTLLVGAGTKLALSRDGTKIVFVGVKNGQRALYLRRIDEPVAQLVRGTDLGSGMTGVSPTFSPQGDWILFTVGQVLKKIPVAGGTAQTLADSSGSACLGDNGVLLFARISSLWIGTSEGRDARLLAAPDTAHGIFGLRLPEVLPGGRYALVTINRAPGGPAVVDSMRLAVVDLKSGVVTDLGVPGTNPHYVSSGHILFGRANNLVFVAPFSLRKRAITGPASLLLQNVWQGPGGYTDFSVSDNGTIVYHEGNTALGNKELVAVSRTGTVRRLPGEAMGFMFPRLSPDGRTIATNVVTRDARWGVSLIDANTGTPERLAAPDSGRNPEWTRDGARARVVFTRRVGDTDEYVSRARDRSSADTVLGRAKARGVLSLGLVMGVPHGLAATTRNGSTSRFKVDLTPMDSVGVFHPFAPSSADNHSPSISADGRLLAWVSNESGANQVYVQPMSGGARIPVSVNGGFEPLWSRSGTTLFYRTPGGRVMSAEIGGSPLRVTRRDSLFADLFLRASPAGRQWDVFPDGKEFLMVRLLDGETNGVFVVLNWPQLKVSPSTAARP